jgi:hypothetical protein
VELIDEVPAMVEPVHPPMLPVGGATPISGLTPALPSSVAPSGMLPPARGVPGVDSDEAVPPEDEAEAAAQLVAAAPLIPPPSKVESAELGPAPAQAGDIAGLSPAELISVAPRPIPALGPATAAESLTPGIPSGEAGPIAGAPGVADIVCAATAPQLNKSATAAADNRRIETSCARLQRRAVIGLGG